MNKLFGTDGMRGEAGAFPLDEETIRTVGFSLTTHLSERLRRLPVIVVGRDTRESGDWLERVLIEGALRAGAECRSAGIITTPGVAFLTRHLPADAGVVISASHNPFHDNGIKIFAPSGKKLDDETETLIEADIFAKSETTQKEVRVEDQVNNDEVVLRSAYLDFLADEIGQGLRPIGMKMVVDCANGAASNLAPILFKHLGADVVAINNSPDGRNINQNSGSLHIETLQERVLLEHADLGVAFDGDADRSLFIDARGNFVDGDATLWVLAQYLQERNELSHAMVVATVMSNVGLEIALASRGLRLMRTAVGDKYVLDALLSSGASLGGEQSGHIILPRLSLAGDGLITTLCLIRAMKEKGKELSELIEGFHRYPQVLVNVKVREKRPFLEVGSIADLMAEIEARLGNQGRLLVRYSGTEPLARVMIEGKNQSEIDGYATDLAARIQDALGAG
jgi:phosphoglucosamine mutase